MKRSFLLCVAAVLFVSSMIGTSCRKHIIHSNAPTPNNVRMLGYTKITTIKLTNPIGGTPATINENYRFEYDEGNRVSRIIFTSNDSFTVHMISVFKYVGDTIFKTTTNALDNAFLQKDTFIVNSNGMLTTAYTPYLMNKYEYGSGKLLTRETQTATSYKRNMTLTTTSTYTSVDQDFLKNYYDGTMDLKTYNFTTPLTLEWQQDFKPLTIWNYGSLDYKKEGYNYHPLYLHVTDTNRVVDSLDFPGRTFYNESYHFYTEDANRTGDYLQLQSFTKYGKNVYQNKHLVESITNQNFNTYIKYKIDAFSKITQTQAVETDSLLNTRTYVYDIQYEQF